MSRPSRDQPEQKATIVPILDRRREEEAILEPRDQGHKAKAEIVGGSCPGLPWAVPRQKLGSPRNIA